MYLFIKLYKIFKNNEFKYLFALPSHSEYKENNCCFIKIHEKSSNVFIARGFLKIGKNIEDFKLNLFNLLR